MSVHDKMVNEGGGASLAVRDVIRQNRGGPFKVSDARPCGDAVNEMTAVQGHSKVGFALHVDSVNAHYDILSSLTDTVRPEDAPFIEAHQTPVILEIPYEEDPALKASMWKFIEAIEANRSMIGLEAVQR